MAADIQVEAAPSHGWPVFNHQTGQGERGTLAGEQLAKGLDATGYARWRRALYADFPGVHDEAIRFISEPGVCRQGGLRGGWKGEGQMDGAGFGRDERGRDPIFPLKIVGQQAGLRAQSRFGR